MAATGLLGSDPQPGKHVGAALVGMAGAPVCLPGRQRTCAKCFLLAAAALVPLPSPLIVRC
jgi:hypothetical protein